MDWKKVIQQAYSHGKAAGLTQNEIARRTGAHQKQISQLATGKVEPRLGFALRFFEAVGLDFVLTARDKGIKPIKNEKSKVRSRKNLSDHGRGKG